MDVYSVVRKYDKMELNENEVLQQTHSAALIYVSICLEEIRMIQVSRTRFCLKAETQNQTGGFAMDHEHSTKVSTRKK